MKNRRSRSLILLPAILLLAVLLGVVSAPYLLPLVWSERPFAVTNDSSLRLAVSVGLLGLVVCGLAYLKWSEDLQHQRDRDRLDAFLEHIPENFYFKDHESRFVRVRSSLVRYWGLAVPVQVVRESDADRFTKEHVDNALVDEQEFMHSGRSTIEIEEKGTWPDGR